MSFWKNLLSMLSNGDDITIFNRASGAIPFIISYIVQNTYKRIVVTSSDSRQIVDTGVTLEGLTASAVCILTDKTRLNITDSTNRLVLINVKTLLSPIEGRKRRAVLELNVGEEAGFEYVMDMLVKGGYTKVGEVFEEGDFSIKGGILDVILYENANHVKVEFSGDSIETLMIFDKKSNMKLVEHVSVPLLEDKPREMPLYSLIEGDDVLYVLLDVGEDVISPKGQKVWISSLSDSGADLVSPFVPSPLEYAGSMGLVVRSIEEKVQQGYKVCICSSNVDKVHAFLSERGLDGVEVKGIPITEGFIDSSVIPHVIYVAEREITGRVIFARSRCVHDRFSSSVSAPLDETVKDGDYVVHIDHGIGIFRGLKELQVGGKTGRYFVIEYADHDMLYVPESQSSRVQKYIGKEHPYVYRLSETKRWELIKSKTRRAIRVIAEDLVHLYAMRQISKGYAFSPDTPWQVEFEDDFMFEETEDQKKAIEDVKRDMEKEIPMDRLICGEAGYGKTEIAMRAAFKAVMDHKQVAVVCPTTILAQQHYYTFTERMRKFPVRIEMLSRFVSPKEQRKIIDACKEGKVDIIIGTHRLLQKDVGFKDLGLVIVDEEQRFGVMQKEHLKRMKLNVDVLTISATPIPRTLYMSLVGIRDISVVATPPKDRVPVEIKIRKFDEGYVKSVIEEEIRRRSQIFYIHNSISGTYKVKRWLEDTFPDIRVDIAHGEMNPLELKRVLTELLSHSIDVLVATTIVEDGLDMPFANTIVVDKAEMLGISQLYQLVGRVGRRNVQGRAYILYSDERHMTEDARKRLAAIREFAESGSSFGLAMRDLEIRGVGNVLGEEQHGLVNQIGLSLYTQILQEEIEKMKSLVYEGTSEVAV